ncbi:MAG: glyoxalase [Ignavibacteriae bacterium]|nr:glyoxalase [Ignavibacteriota bacterium]MCB9214565.1 glyoxalase [Ignavibacteria bacterium]
MILKANLILYVANQEQSTSFYTYTLGQSPNLNVPGMTEFHLSETVTLGLMPEAGIKRLLGESLPDPSVGNGIPRAEVYLTVDDPQLYLQRALEAGARQLDALRNRGWGDEAGYCLDPDGHVLVFAKRSSS